MTKQAVLVIGGGHLAERIRQVAASRGHTVSQGRYDDLRAENPQASAFDAITSALQRIDLASLACIFLVDDRDEHNFALLVALTGTHGCGRIVAALFNENIAPHLQAANPNVAILNPARIAAPTFVAALDTPVTHELRYTPARILTAPSLARPDRLIRRLTGCFAVLVAVAVIFFHFAEHLSWLNAVYFVIVTVATVGYGDITLLNAGMMSKVVGIALILSSTAFIWMIFSLTIDGIIKRRGQLAMGRKRYNRQGHVILCGLGRLGYFVGEGLLARGERLIIVESDADSPAIEHFRRLGADVYIGDARLPRVLQDVCASRAKALYSLVDDDFTNLEIGLNARSFMPSLRLILRIFDASMSKRVSDTLDIHLTFSMSAIADEYFIEAMSAV